MRMCSLGTSAVKKPAVLTLPTGPTTLHVAGCHPTYRCSNKLGHASPLLREEVMPSRADLGDCRGIPDSEGIGRQAVK
jgi:hypothetical protein